MIGRDGLPRGSVPEDVVFSEAHMAYVRPREGGGWDVVTDGGEYLPGQGFPGATCPPPEPPGVFSSDMHTAKDPNPKHAAGLAKPPLHLVPASAQVIESMVFKLGAKKYGPMNWRESPVVRSIYLDAAMRHLLALMDGQDVDEESGLPHEGHVRACMAILLDARAAGKLIDDRPPNGPVAAVLRDYTEKTGAR